MNEDYTAETAVLKRTIAELSKELKEQQHHRGKTPEYSHSKELTSRYNDLQKDTDLLKKEIDSLSQRNSADKQLLQQKIRQNDDLTAKLNQMGQLLL
jgi:hypothetical protein